MKILILGNSGCGKSSLLLRYVDDAFSDEFVSSVGVDFREKMIQKGADKIRLQVIKSYNTHNDVSNRFGIPLDKIDISL